MPRAAIIILNWNGWADTIQCIKSIHQLSSADYDVVLIDNHSTDHSVEKIRRFCEGTDEPDTINNRPIHLFEMPESEAVRLDLSLYYRLDPHRRLIMIKNNENYGYARGNNIGIRFALNILKTEYILILNNDVILNDREMLNKLIKLASSDNHIGAVSPVLKSTTGEIQRTCTGNLPDFLDFIFIYTFIGQKLFPENWILKKHFNYDYTFDRPEEFGVLGGSCILFRSQAIADINLFDENTFLYWEEYIIGSKFAERGWKLVLCSEAEVIHKGESCITNLNLKSWARYWSIKSELYYIRRYTSLNAIQKGIIVATLLLEAGLAFSDAVLRKKGSKFDKEYELKIISILLRSFGKNRDSLR